jgi:signal transduction histidine kinase
MKSVVGAPTEKKRSVGVAVGVALLLALLVVGISFANAIGAGRVAGNARILHWANATSGTTTALRLTMAQASTFVELASTGQATQEDVAYAMEQVMSARAELAALDAAGVNAVSHPFLEHLLGTVDEFVAELESGDHLTAEQVFVDEFEPVYTDLAESLAAEQADIQAQIEANTAGAARAADFVRFFLLFAVPASAVVVYRYLAKRAMKERQIVAEVELEAEREVGRAKDEFIAGLSHELRTPLTSIYGFAEVLAEEGIDPERTREIAGIIANESAELTRMVDDLLMAARMESVGIEITKTPTSVAEVVESAVAPFGKAGMSLDISGDSVTVNTDAPRLRHVIVNLLSNAARHGGSKVGVEYSADESSVAIEVWDTGAGVPEEQMETLFRRFKHDGEQSLLTGSLGMGLAVASRLVAMLGGELSYQRFVGRTYFTVRLPASEMATLPEPETQTVAEMIKALSA